MLTPALGASAQSFNPTLKTRTVGLGRRGPLSGEVPSTAQRRKLRPAFTFLKIFSNENRPTAVFIFVERRTVTERALTQNALLMTTTNEDALEAMVREHAGLVYRIAYSVSRNHHDAEDVTQETFVRVLRYRRKIEDVNQQKAWIARIAWHVALDQAKKSSAITLSEKAVGEAISQLRANGKSAEELAASHEMASVLNSLIAALPEALRDAMRLSTVEELLPGEIARVLETTEASVRARLFRARQILKDKLKALGASHGFTE